MKKWSVLVIVLLAGCLSQPEKPTTTHYEVAADLSAATLYAATVEWMSTVLPSWNSRTDKMQLADALFYGATRVDPNATNQPQQLGVMYQSDETLRVRGMGQIDIFYMIMSYPIRFTLSAQIKEGAVTFDFSNMIVARQGGGSIERQGAEGTLHTFLLEAEHLIENYKEFLREFYLS